LGGSSKNSNFAELGKVISTSDSIRAIIGIGKEWERIKPEIRNSKHKILTIEDCKNMKEIIQKSKEVAQSGDVVLLSPACASFGMFQNYKDRGEQFKREVQALSS
jgi:UDP-N-acetylmuramoylalanine--D-glutamate ligase